MSTPYAFRKLPSGSFINLSHIVRAEPYTDGDDMPWIEVHFDVASSHCESECVIVNYYGDDAQAIIRHLENTMPYTVDRIAKGENERTRNSE